MGEERMQVIGALLSIVITIYMAVMWGRLIFDYVQLFARSWKPRGILLVLAELIYTLTDPPIKAVRKVVPPLRLGNIAIDLGWIIIMFALVILLNLVEIFVR